MLPELFISDTCVHCCSKQTRKNCFSKVRNNRFTLIDHSQKYPLAFGTKDNKCVDIKLIIAQTGVKCTLI